MNRVTILLFIWFQSLIFCSMLVGGPRNMSPDEQKQNKDLQDSLREAVAMFNAMHNSMYKHDIGKILSATSQVVQGVRYVVIAEFAPTRCRNNEDSMMLTLRECPIKPGGRVIKKEISIWSRPWLSGNQKLIIDITDVKDDEEAFEF